MKKILWQLFLCKDALISPKIMQLIQCPWGAPCLVHGPHDSQLSAATVIIPPFISVRARRRLIFSSGRFIINNSLNGVSFHLEGMSPCHGSQEDHWKGKISWKCHFQAKPDSILLEKCMRGFHEGAETGPRRGPGVFGGRMSLRCAP
jgi:hypothetical protein